MRSFTDIFIKHPVLAVVVNLVIVLVGWRALTSLPVQQYPKIESSSVVITTVYTGASAETVRGFLTTPIERAVSAISGVDYIESTSRAGVSTVTVRLKLNHSSTAALAEVTARLQQVRSELPAEAEPPVVEVQRADRPYASFYLSFTSTERSVPAITDWLLRTLQPQLATLAGVQRVDDRGRPPDRHARLDRSRPARRAQPLARRRARGAPAQQLPRRRRPDQGQPRAGQPAREHRPALGRRVRGPDRRRPRRRDRAPDATWRASSSAPKRPTWSRSTTTRKASTSASGRSSARTRSTSRTACAPRWSASGRRCRATSTCSSRTTARCSWRTRSKEITKTLSETILIVGARGVPVHGLGPHGARAARRDAGLAGRRGDRHVRLRLQPEPADDARDRAVGRTGRRRRDRRRRERRAARARGQVRASRRR